MRRSGAGVAALMVIVFLGSPACASKHGLRNSWSSSFEFGTTHPYEAPVSFTEQPAYDSTTGTFRYSATIWSSKVTLYDRLGQEAEPVAGKVTPEEESLSRTFPNAVGIQVAYWGSASLMRTTMEFWRSQSSEDLRRQVTLVIDGKRIPPLHVLPRVSTTHYGGWLQIIFPRQVDGKPLLSRATRKVRLEIKDPNARVRLPFDVRKMIVDGEVMY